MNTHTWQGMNIDYKYFVHECEMDCPILVTTRGSKLLLGKVEI